MEYFPSGWRGEVVLATLVCLVLSRFLYRKKRDIPTANGCFPLLGHALAYRKDPATFLQSQPHTVFRINLAGREMIVVTNDARAIKQVATLPEKTMSARQAVADVGFEYTLGSLNVYKGTDWHKRILKDFIYNHKKDVLPTIFQCLVAALDKETKNYTTKTIVVDDLFVLIRRTMLRAMLTYMIAPGILDGQNEHFLDDFMVFQDMVEDATAKAAVLPRFISIPFVLMPVQQRREELTLILTNMIGCIWKNGGDAAGPWLTAFENDGISANEAAELTMGLMFAAHKNPAIGVSQCFCYLQTEATKEQQETAALEAKCMYDSYSNGKQPPPASETESLRCCVLETLRLTAHSIGGIRTVQKDTVLETSSGQTYSLKKEDVICVSHIATHRDPSIWGADALYYRQERWLTLLAENSTTASMGVPVDEYKYTTFSHGIHKCPGEGLALSIMEMMLAILLKRNAELVDKERMPKVSFERATLAQREDKVPITIDTVR